MKKIAIISHSAAHGGAERVATLLANHFAEQGHDVNFYAIHSDAREYPLDDRITYEYCDVTGNNKVLKQIKRAWKIRKYILDNKIDIMISFLYLEGIFLIGNHKAKKIYSLRNDPSTICKSGIEEMLFRLIYRDADKIVFQTPDARDYFSDKIRKKGVLIANPLKGELPYWKKDNHKKEIMAVCRIEAQKNLKMLLDAYKIFRNERKDYNLVIYGKGTLRESLEKYAESQELNDSVSFYGFCNDVHQKMTEAGMYVSSSDYEGISNSMLEALAIGVPTVCTDCPVGGARMFINSGENGFLVPVGDAQTMASKMLELASDETLQETFSMKSQNIRNELAPKKIFEKWDLLI